MALVKFCESAVGGRGNNIPKGYMWPRAMTVSSTRRLAGGRFSYPGSLEIWKSREPKLQQFQADSGGCNAEVWLTLLLVFAPHRIQIIRTGRSSDLPWFILRLPLTPLLLFSTPY